MKPISDPYRSKRDELAFSIPAAPALHRERGFGAMDKSYVGRQDTGFYLVGSRVPLGFVVPK